MSLQLAMSIGKNLSFSDINVQPWWVQVPTGKSLLFPSTKIISSTLNVGEIMKSMYILLKLVGASLEVRATSLMKRILEAYSWRLIVYEGGYAASNGERLLQDLIPLRMMMGMATIGLGQGLPPVNLFRMMRVTIISVGIRVHLTKASTAML